jgi:tRNA-2-methylthio-N6-dimethylallyladenosine synthase
LQGRQHVKSFEKLGITAAFCLVLVLLLWYDILVKIALIITLLEEQNLDRNDVLISGEALERQREFEKKIQAMFATREAHPAACVDTFGCQQNVADGQQIMGMLETMGFTFTDKPEDADVVILNTCAVREHAEDRVFGNLGALTHTKKANPEQVICLCGCMAQEERVSERVKKSYPHVNLVFGPHALWKFPELLWQVYEKRKRVFSVSDEHGSIAEGIPIVREDGIKAWVSIMYGCNNFCSYCIVPYVRGRERSRDPECVVQEVRSLVEAGYKDITLLGQNVNSYGNDLPTGVDFSELLKKIDAIPGDYLIRFMSSHPKDATHKLFDTMASSTHVARQLHLPFQSGNDRVLKEMNRRYTRAQYTELVTYARSKMPELVITSDVIIGFPGETESEAMDTVSLVKEIGFDALFTFIYSPRPGTKAAAMPDPASREEKQTWFDALLDAQNEHSAAVHKGYIGKTLRCLVDGKSDDEVFPLSARTEGNRLVRFKGDESLIGQFVNIKITDSNTWALYGETDA